MYHGGRGEAVPWRSRQGKLDAPGNQSGLQRRIQGDLGVQELRHGITRFGLGGEFVEFRLVGPRDLGFQGQVDRRDGLVVVDLVERDVGRWLHALGRQSGLAQDQRQVHCEEAGVGRADQLLRVGAGLALEAAAEA